MRVLFTVAFVAGLIPAVLLWVLYGTRTRWWATDAGWVVFALVSVTAVTYLVSAATLLWPEFFAAGEVPESGPGLWIRIATRFAVAAVLWALFRLFVRAQREDRPPLVPPRGAEHRR